MPSDRKRDSLVAIDLCAGAGGWACAAAGLPIKIREAVDLDPFALETYKWNHPKTTTTCRDVAELPADSAWIEANRDVDLIVGGIPCEAIAAWRRADGRRPSPEEIERRLHRPLDASLEVVKLLKPRFWCLEDVSEVIGHLPPLTPHQVINSKAFSAQSRKRAYVGNFPTPESNGGSGVLGDVLRPGPHRLGRRVVSRTPKRQQNHTGENHSWWDPERPSHTVCNVSSRRDVETVVVSSDGRRRQMEWQEAAILQGFPGSYTFIGSPTQVTKHIGQAIQIDTGRAILAAIVKSIR